ncbi:hypothetical protein [Streptomyces litmocidini]|uniref:hypothetical protein n=1 Tax=Streptomyces litmocidini TaxID=67318 RepID=UPI003700002F
MGYWPGSAMTTAWTARSDTDGTPSEDAPDRTWLIGDSVVRGGSEGVRSFDAATGDEEERVFRDLEAPAREVLPYGDLLIAVHPVGDRCLSAYEPW